RHGLNDLRMTVVELYPTFGGQFKSGVIDVSIGKRSSIGLAGTGGDAWIQFRLRFVAFRNFVCDDGHVGVKLWRHSSLAIGTATARHAKVLEGSIHLRWMRQCAAEGFAAFNTRRRPDHLLHALCRRNPRSARFAPSW